MKPARLHRRRRCQSSFQRQKGRGGAVQADERSGARPPSTLPRTRLSLQALLFSSLSAAAPNRPTNHRRLSFKASGNC